jgi:hypothetical protein
MRDSTAHGDCLPSDRPRGSCGTACRRREELERCVRRVRQQKKCCDVRRRKSSMPPDLPQLRRRRPRSCSCCPRPRRRLRCCRLAARRRLPSRLSPEALDAPARSRPGWCQRARSSSCRRRRRGPCPRPRRQLPARLLLPRRARVRVGERCLLRVDAHQLPRRLVVLELADVGRGGRHLGVGAGVGEDEVVGQAALGAAGKGRGGRRG